MIKNIPSAKFLENIIPVSTWDTLIQLFYHYKFNSLYANLFSGIMVRIIELGCKSTLF